jgi:hypothetical protein
MLLVANVEGAALLVGSKRLPTSYFVEPLQYIFGAVVNISAPFQASSFCSDSGGMTMASAVE